MPTEFCGCGAWPDHIKQQSLISGVLISVQFDGASGWTLLAGSHRLSAEVRDRLAEAGRETDQQTPRART